ncbi:MAG: hypothetical protein IKR29_02805 [Bacteroidales bacterium]|nr:hypothetical protein [Bacteroidales bacterium]
MKRKTENGERKMGNKYISLGLLVVLFFATTWEGLAQGDLRKNAMYFSKGIELKYKDDVEGAIENFEKALQCMPDDAASMFELSEQYVKAGRVEDAFASIKKAVELDPDNKWYQMRLARFYRNFEQYADFIQVYESLTAKYPEDIDMLSELIEVYLIAGEYDSALNKLDLLETQIGPNPLISEQRLEIYKRQGKTKQEIAALQEMIAQNPENTRYYHILAKVYMENKKEKEAAKLYEQIKSIDPSDPYINISLLEYYEKKGDLDKAFEELIAAIKNKNLDFNTKANIYEYWFNKFQTGKNIDQQALQAGNAFLETYPDNKMGYLILGSYYLNRKEYEPCSDMARHALALDPANYAAWQNLVWCDVSMNATDSLMVHATQAVQLYPTQPYFYWFAGSAYAMKGEDQEAISYFERGRRFVTDKSMLVDFDGMLGDLYHSLGDEEQAFLAYDRVLSNDPDRTLVLNNYAYYLALGQKELDKALAMASHAVALEPDNAVYLDTYAWVLYQRGEYEAAEVQMSKSIKLLKQPDKTYYHHYADILEKLNKQDKANEYRDKAAAL